MSISQQRHPTSGCHDNTLPSDGRDVAAAAAVISAAVGKQLFDNTSQQQQHVTGSKITELAGSDVTRRRCDVTANSGNPARREPAAASATKAKSEIQKFYQIKEKVINRQ